MQASVSNNETIKISAAVAASGAAGTIYTCPANSYAIINVMRTTGNTGLQIGGQQVLLNSSIVWTEPYAMYVGPNQTVVVTTDSAGTMAISGVEFVNSP